MAWKLSSDNSIVGEKQVLSITSCQSYNNIVQELNLGEFDVKIFWSDVLRKTPLPLHTIK